MFSPAPAPVPTSCKRNVTGASEIGGRPGSESGRTDDSASGLIAKGRPAPEQWVRVGSRGRHGRNDSRAIVGCAERGDVQDTVEAVPKMSSLYISRIKPGTTTEQMQNFVRRNFTEAQCELLQSRHPSFYSSFKITLYESSIGRAFVPDIWPQGALVDKFFQRRVRKVATA